MKNILCIVTCLLGAVFASCEQQLDTWSGEDVVYLNQTEDSTIVSFAYIDSKYHFDTVYIQARVMGEVTEEHSRFLSIRVSEGNAVAGVDYEPLQDEYEIEPGKTFAYIPVYLIRHEGLKEVKTLTVELLANEDFSLRYPTDVLTTGTTIQHTKISHRIIFHELMLEAQGLGVNINSVNLLQRNLR